MPEVWIAGSSNLELPCICFHLGLRHDRETRLAFPSPGNYCFRDEECLAVALHYQASTCLTQAYATCQGPGKNLRPLSFQERTPYLSWRRWRVQILLVFAGVLLLLVLATIILVSRGGM